MRDPATTLAPEAPSKGDRIAEARRQLLAQRRRGQPVDTAADRIPSRPLGAAVPISAEQYRVWLHATTNPELPLYNEPITIHRHGSFSLEVLEATLTEILRRHEAWRTSFGVVDTELRQIVHSSIRVLLPFTDLSAFPIREQEAEVLRLATIDAASPIPLDRAPLFRGRVFRMAEDKHRVQLTLHHIIFDGVSIYRILMPELAAIYDAFAEGKPSPLPEPPLQYGDYAVWRHRHVTSAPVVRQLEYWKGELSGELPVLNLPTDRPRPGRMSHRGAMECFRLPVESVRDLRRLSQAHGVTLYMTLLAAFKVLLFRYSGQHDVIVGGATDARRRPELEGLMGYFLDTFAIRSRPRPETRFQDYLLEVRQTVLGALAAVDVPFEQIVRAVQPQRSSSFHPIFQAFFSIEPPVAPFAEGWDLTQMDVTAGSAKFDLYLELDERPDHMAARFMYNTDIFDAETIRRMAGHWQVLLEAVVRTPAATLGSLPLLTPEEHASLTGPGGWNDTGREIPPITLHELIAGQAERTPQKIAVVMGEVSWTYQELMDRAKVLCAYLQQSGVRRGSLVAIFAHRSLDLLAGMLAVLRAGAVYLPLDPELPEVRTALCLEAADPVAIFTNLSLCEKLPSSAAEVLALEHCTSSELAELASDPATEEDLAYVIHTSGTTGRPKAVEISHRSLVNLLTSMQREPGFSAEDRLLAITTISFDIAALELFLPLICGGTVCLASRQTVLDPYLLAEAIESSACTVVQATPATWLSLLSTGWRGASRSLRALCGGEPLSRELAERLLATGVELWNVYGPTETTVWSSVERVEHGTGPILIGRPIANTTAFVLDGNKQLVPVGVPGQLYLGGAGLARGYRGQRQMTDDRFLSVEAAGGTRLYCTGDLAIRRADGRLGCLGRTDNQVKVRGFRVELEAVEAAVRRHPRVASTAARVWPDVTGGMRLSVYVVGHQADPPDAAMLRQFLRTDQPDYMIPSDVVALDALPLSANGKIDRAALPPPPTGEVADAVSEQRTEFEQRLCSVWQELLGVSPISKREEFFNLGGHSLLVATLQQRIETAFGHRLSMAALFNAPTVQEQAKLLEAANDLPALGLTPLQPTGRRATLFWLHPPPLLGNLAAALGSDQPVMGLELTPHDLTELAAAPSLEQIAAKHVQTILRTQPQGPYYLGGLCTGGILAFETAAQMRSAGHDVALLVLLDAQNPVFYKQIGNLKVELNKTQFYLRQALKKVGSHGRATLRQRLLYRVRQVWPPATVCTEVVAGERMTDSAAYRYRPPSYSGNVLLLQPVDRPSMVNHLPGWKTVVSGRLITTDVNGHHDELLNLHNARGVAEPMARHLAEAESSRGRQS